MSNSEGEPGFSLPVRVYYEDTDSGGVVYYANYLKFMERARTEWLRSLGFEQDALREREGVIFAVRRAEIDYRKPAVFNDLLTVTADLSGSGRASLGLRAPSAARSGRHSLLSGPDKGRLHQRENTASPTHTRKTAGGDRQCTLSFPSSTWY